MEYLVTAYTDKGTRRSTNQDSLCVRRARDRGGGEILLAVVSDGMGGLSCGEVASAACVRRFAAWFDANLPLLPDLCGNRFALVRAQWGEMIASLHEELRDRAEESGSQMGATVTAIFACGGRYLTVNVGDSRIYERRQSLRQLTRDQSLVAREIERGRITEGQARRHPQRNILLQCLGVGEPPEPAFTEAAVEGGALYLLCSDGFCHEIPPEEMEELLFPERLPDKEAMTRRLTEMTELCKARGENDNITAVLFAARETAVKKEPLLRRLFGKQDEEEGVTLLETALIVHTEDFI